MRNETRRRFAAALILAVLTLGALASLMPWRTSPAVIWGDEGTFLAMANSVAQDGDLRFDDRDRERLEAIDPNDRGAATVILQRAPDGTFAYSKPLVYPLITAPLVALLGRFGPIAFNVLILGAALALAYTDLVRRSDPGRAALVIVTFVGAAAVLPYTLWRMSDIAQLAFVLMGLVLALRPHGDAHTVDRPPAGPLVRRLDRLMAWRFAPHLGCVLLAAAAIMRINNLALAAVPTIAALLSRDLRRAIVLALTTATATAGFVAAGAALTGAPNPYRALRSSFNQETGYPKPPAANEAATLDTFETALATRPATHQTGAIPNAGIDRVMYAVGYFFLGRHTGLLIYFPAALILGIAALRHRDAAGIAAMIGFAGSAIFFLVWMPFNYFGGNTFIGNRYLLSAYPALLLAPRRLPGGRALGVAWVLAAIAYASAWWSAHAYHERDISSQNHTRAGIFRALPYESVARDLSGNDRYWGELFVRFVDPIADVGTWSFEIHSNRPAAELLVAQWQPSGPLRFRIETDAADAQLVIRDWRGRHRFPVGASTRDGPATVIDVDLSSPWRRHRFWWHATQTYATRLLRVGLETPDGISSSARIRLLGIPELLESAFAYEVLTTAIPEPAIAGAADTISIEVRNTSGRAWTSQAVTPVFVRQRFTLSRTAPMTPGGAASHQRPLAGPNIPLPETVEPGATMRLEIPVTWPPDAGTYRLDLDLVLAHVGAFRSRLGTPMVEADITVRPSDDPEHTP